MPRKRNIRKTGELVAKKFQKKQLESRLMQISIVIDECVYQNKRVSASNAAAYLAEVANYKAQGVGDARSLQVIEKIIRCMKAIIEEQQEGSLVDKTEDTHNLNTYCPSPVYSLPDEDRIMSSQDSMNVLIDTSSNKNLEQMYTIQLCDDDDDELYKNIQVDVEIHRAMSGLSLREDETQISDQFSQSILETFEPARVGVLTKPIIDFKINQNNLPKQPISDSQNSISNVANKTPITPQKLENKIVHFEEDDIMFVEPKEPPIITRKKPIKKLKNNDSKKGARQKENRNKNEKSNGTKQRKKRCDENKKNARTTEKSKSHHKVKKTTKAVSGINKSNSFSDTAASMKIIKNQTETKSNSYHPSANSVCPSKQTKDIGKIYTKNTENDLSWIENISYVREVANEECDTQFLNLEETFWENLTFPSNWNDKDFDY